MLVTSSMPGVTWALPWQLTDEREFFKNVQNN